MELRKKTTYKLITGIVFVLSALIISNILKIGNNTLEIALINYVIPSILMVSGGVRIRDAMHAYIVDFQIKKGIKTGKNKEK